MLALQAITGLATAAYDNARDLGQVDAENEVTTYILSSVFQPMIWP